MSSPKAARRRLWIAGGLATALAGVLACRPATPPVSRPEPRPPVKLEARRIERHEVVPPLPEPPGPVGPLAVRVGLASDLAALDLPCCDPRLALVAGGASLELDQTTRVAPSAGLGDRAVLRLQVAALKDERQALGLSQRLQRDTGEPADAVFDAGTGLYRVRVGRYASRQQADAGRRRLEVLGLGGGWIATEGEAPDDPAFEITRDGGSIEVPGRWLEVAAPEGGGIPFDGASYRGRLLIFLNDRGGLNVVNELEIEDYLRGVVPKEMGPELYGQLEALKAQTVAARTYAVRNLEEFAAEGFDICSTPRCQVYGGMTVEHPLSDRAITETAGQVLLFGGEPAETLYGATCGGHTEDVEVIFPAKTGAYLRGVPCLESGVSRLAGEAPAGASLPSVVSRRLLPESGGKAPRKLAARMEHLALLAGLPVPRDRLHSMQRREVLRFATSVYDLALDRRLRSPLPELEGLLEQPPPGWRDRERELATFLVASGLLASPGTEAVDEAQADELLFELAVYLGVVERRGLGFLKLAHRHLEARDGGERRAYDLPADLATFGRRGEALRGAALDLMAGDRLELYLHRGRPLALVQPDEVGVVKLDGRAPKRSWSRFIPASQLKASVQARYPGFPFEGFEVLERGVSGRVARLRLLGTGGETLEIEGLAVRWTLDVWDNLFWAEAVNGSGNQPGWLFRGKGWGHGVGMCQAGAYGMAMRGAGYRHILEHYYTGIELGRLKPVPERPRLGG